MNLRYTLGAIVTIPLLPIMYWQGKKIRASVPSLPEATGIEGFVDVKSDRTMRILAIGESTIAGVGVATHEDGFTAAFANELATRLHVNVYWKVYARGGYTIQKVTDKIVPKITERDVDLIVIGTGGNDAFTLNTPKKWHKSVIQLIDNLQIRFGDTPIAFANVPPIKEFPAFTPLIKFTIGNLGEILGEVLDKAIDNRLNIYFNAEKITLKDWSKRYDYQGTAKDYFSDGVHPSKLTYQTWGKDFARFLVEQTDAIDIT